jgi:tetratricopeptide (TPR) repeat protein
MTLAPIVRKVLLGAAESSLDVAGAALLPGAWPVLKGALEPVLDRLKERLGGEDIILSPARAAAAATAFEADPHLQEMLRSRLLERLDRLVQDQEKIGADVQKLMLIVSGDQGLLQELLGGVGRIEERLDEGVDLSERSFSKLVQAISRQAETSRQVRALALREMGPVGELLERQVGRLQVRAVELVEAGALDRAIDELREGLLLVATLLAEAPTDIRLRLQLGFIHKTAAQVFEATEDRERAEAHIKLAEEIFRFVREEVRGDQKIALDVANAIHGLGNVDHQRRDFQAAIAKYELAVSIYPDQVYSWHDMFGAYHELARHGAVDLAAMRRAFEQVKRRGEGVPGLGKQKVARLEHILRGLEDGHAARPVPPSGQTRVSSSNEGPAISPTFLTIVVAEQQPDTVILNLNCRITNPRPTSLRLRRLDAQITAPGGARLDLAWTVFYDFDPSKLPLGGRMTKTCDACEIEIASGESLSLGIQFASPVTESVHLWIPGDYACDLRGWANVEPEQSAPSLRTTFKVTMGAGDVHQIQSWQQATKQQWDRLNDPDRAIGIPVRIGGVAVAPG